MEYRIKGLLDTKAAAEIIGISRSKLENMRYAGCGPDYFCQGRSVRYRPEDIDKFIDSKTVRIPKTKLH